MRTIAIMAGRYNPPHQGHKSVYDTLVKKFGVENTFVVTSDKQDPQKSPFSFIEKQKLWQVLGVPKANIVQIKNPYMPVEVTNKFDQEQTAIVFAVSQKDADRFTFKPKKDGSASYMQPYKKGPLKPLSTSGYIMIAPTIKFSIMGNQVNSATEIRQMYASAPNEIKQKILTDLYGTYKEEMKNLFDIKLGGITTESYLREFINFINKF